MAVKTELEMSVQSVEKGYQSLRYWFIHAKKPDMLNLTTEQENVLSGILNDLTKAVKTLKEQAEKIKK